jgi:glyoxylase-like metal-dependent hydrolase (beta-lactamase superfamily II)
VEVLRQLEPLRPAVIVPAHGPVGGGELIGEQRQAFEWIRLRVRALKAQGQSVDDVVKTLTTEFQMQHPDWTAANRVAPIARAMYGE